MWMVLCLDLVVDDCGVAVDAALGGSEVYRLVRAPVSCEEVWEVSK